VRTGPGSKTTRVSGGTRTAGGYDHRVIRGLVDGRTIAAAALLLAAAVAGCGHAPEAGVRAERIAIPAPSLAGSVIHNAPEQPALVLLPASYAFSNRSYPVIYFLAGFTTDVTEFIDGTIEGLDLRRLLAEHCARRPEAEAIVVVPNGRNVLGGSFYVNSPVTGRWEDYLVADVVPWVDAHYRTVRDRGSRLLAGEGMGGFGALHVAMLHPDAFGAVYAIGPEAFDETGLDDLGIVTRPVLVKAWFLTQDRMAGWPAQEAPRRLAGLMGELYAADSGRFNRPRGSAYAYGAAFAPDPRGGPPYVAYPWRETASGPVADPEYRLAWERGYGAWEEKIARNLEGLRSLRAIGIDVAAGDLKRASRAWIPRGGRKVAALFREAGIGIEYVEHDGEHYDRLAARIEQGLLPFFARFASGASGDSPREAKR
jgi:hypothetical protein